MINPSLEYLARLCVPYWILDLDWPEAWVRSSCRPCPVPLPVRRCTVHWVISSTTSASTLTASQMKALQPRADIHTHKPHTSMSISKSACANLNSFSSSSNLHLWIFFSTSNLSVVTTHPATQSETWVFSLTPSYLPTANQWPSPLGSTS